MVRRTRRWRPPPQKVLSLPTSKHTELCYAFEGKAHYHGPLRGERVELLLIDQERRTRWVDSPAGLSLIYPVEEDCNGWRVLGWRMPSDQLRHGDYDVVDPELADLDRCPGRTRNFTSAIRAVRSGRKQQCARPDLPADDPKRMIDWRR